MAGVAATFVNDAFDCFLIQAGVLLDASHQLVRLTVNELQAVVRKLRESLFQLTLGNVPVSFRLQCIHNCFVGVAGFVVGVTAHLGNCFASRVP